MARVSKDLVATAYHEAGHALAGHHVGRAPKRATTVPEGDTLGSCSFYRLRETPSRAWDASNRNRIRLERVIISLLGGCAAEARFRGRYDWVGAHTDWQNAADLSTYQTGSHEKADAHVNGL